MHTLDVVDDSDQDYDDQAGPFDDWESIVKPPQSHPLHTGKANDRLWPMLAVELWIWNGPQV